MSAMEPSSSDELTFVYGFSARPGGSDGAGQTQFAALTSGLLRSSDGKTWTDCLPSQEGTATGVTSVVAPQGDGTVLVGLAGGILVSRDDGLTWGVAKVPSPPPVVTALVASPNFLIDGVALAATMEDGVLRSSDHGSSWIIWNFGLLDLEVLSLAISPDYGEDETLFAGTQSGLFRSTNGGRAWRECTLPGAFDPVLALAISPAYAKDQTLWAGTESGNLFVSVDGGESWETLPGPVAGEAINGLWAGTDAAGGQVLACVCGGRLWLRQGKGHWKEPRHSPQGEISTIHAPSGLARGNTLWVALLGGAIEKLVI